MVVVHLPTSQENRPSWRRCLRHLKLAQPFIHPLYRVQRDGLNVQLWAASYKLPALMLGAPFFRRKQAIIVPVSPNLKMVYGAAKLARDYGADRPQREADRFAPLSPGEALIVSGARYRYAYTALAVIFDHQKQSSPERIVHAVRRAMELARQRDCTGVILPDFTNNLMPQPNQVTPSLQRAVAESTALAMVEAIRACRGLMEQIHIWCYDPSNAEVYLRELKRL